MSAQRCSEPTYPRNNERDVFRLCKAREIQEIHQPEDAHFVKIPDSSVCKLSEPLRPEIVNYPPRVLGKVFSNSLARSGSFMRPPNSRITALYDVQSRKHRHTQPAYFYCGTCEGPTGWVRPHIWETKWALRRRSMGVLGVSCRYRGRAGTQLPT